MEGGAPRQPVSEMCPRGAPNSRPEAAPGLQSSPGSRRVVWLFRKTHLDVGFTDQPEVVVERFVREHFPAAIRAAQQLAADGEPPLVWTSGSWILWQALERSRGPERARLEAAIASGWLAWHALPFTTHSELLDEWLLEVGLSVAEELAARFGRRAISAKLTDVPGHSVGLVPLLADAGVELLHVGVNPASMVPEVPPLFRWRAAGRELLVMYAPLYGVCQELPGGGVVDVWVTGDNVGPPSPAAERRRRVELERAWPGAELRPASLDPIATSLGSRRAELPVVEEEIADTWIHGAAADPALLGRYRTFLHWRRAGWTSVRRSHTGAAGPPFAGGRSSGSLGSPPGSALSGPPSDRLAAAGRALLPVAEHTFGLDTKAVFGPDEPFHGEAFSLARESGRYRALEASWAAKAAAVDDALAAAGVSWGEIAEVMPAVPQVADSEPLLPGEERSEGRWHLCLQLDGSLDLALDAEDGLSSLRLGPYLYQRYCAADYDAYLASYVRPTARSEPWVPGDFAKPGLEALGLSFLERPAALSSAQIGRPAPGSGQRSGPGGRGDSEEVELVVTAELQVPSSPGELLSAPARLGWECALRRDGSVSFVLSRRDKRATRLPEAEWWCWQPQAPRAVGLLFQKLGCWIGADRVVSGGGRHLHGVGRAFALDTGRGRCWLVEPLESPLTAPGPGRLLRPSAELPPPSAGASTCLANNVWGTNFRMWNEGATTHHFLLRRSPTPATDLA